MSYVLIQNVVCLLVSAQPSHSPSQEKISLKNVMEFVKLKPDENQREMNKKLQHMLEETLTKNMHLQQVGLGYQYRLPFDL